MYGGPQVGHRVRNGRNGSLPKLGSYSLMNLLVRNFTVRAARSRKKLAQSPLRCLAADPCRLPLTLGTPYLALADTKLESLGE